MLHQGLIGSPPSWSKWRPQASGHGASKENCSVQGSVRFEAKLCTSKYTDRHIKRIPHIDEVPWQVRDCKSSFKGHGYIAY